MGNFEDSFTGFIFRILRHYDRYLELASGGAVQPVMGVVYPTYGCKLNCLGCDYMSVNRGKAVNMDFRIYERFIRAFARNGGLAVDFSGGGEPMDHPAITDMLELAHSLGLKIGVLTNGLWSHEEVAEVLAETASYVRFSLDCATPEMFERTKRPRGNYTFDQVLENVRSLKSARRRADRPDRVEISLKFLVNRVNKDEVKAFLRLAGKLGVDRVMYKANRNSRYSLAERDLREIEAGLTGYVARMKPPFKTGVWLTRRGVPKRCVINSLVALVDPKGDMYLCSYYLHRAKEHRIGNLRKKSFDEIWGSRYHLRQRAGIDYRKCRVFDCHLAQYQLFLEEFEKSDANNELWFL